MVGLGETNDEIIEVMRDLRRHGVTMLTLGQYLQPSRHHLPVQRYVSPEEFEEMKAEAMAMGFTHAACGPSSALPIMPTCRLKGWKLNNPPLPPLRLFGAAALPLHPFRLSVTVSCIFSPRRRQNDKGRNDKRRGLFAVPPASRQETQPENYSL